MKLIFALLLLLPVFSLSAQDFRPAPADKAVVYFVRASGLGAIINFNHYDGEQLIGRFNAGKYLRYECAPGEHVFWARSENRSFVEADLAAGQTYVVEIVPMMGGLKANVLLVPIDPREKGVPKRIQKLLSRKAPQVFTDEELAKWADNSSGRTENGLERYEKLAEKDRSLPQLTAEMAIAADDLRFSKKKKNK